MKVIMNDEGATIRNEAVLACLKHCSRIFLHGQRKTEIQLSQRLQWEDGA
jgi:hypothetical protein